MAQFHNQNTFQDDVLAKKNITKEGVASENTHLVNKGEVQTQATNIVEAKIKGDLTAPSQVEALSTQGSVNELAKKEERLTVASDSSDVLSITRDGTNTELSINLGGKSILHITDNAVINFSTFIAGVTYNADGFQYAGVQYYAGVLVLLDNNNVNPLETSFIYSGGSDSNTDITASTSWKNISDKYDEAQIRQLFQAGAYVDYDASTGTYSVRVGTDNNSINASTINHNANFSTINPAAKVQNALEALEQFIEDSNTARDTANNSTSTRIDSLVNAGNHLGSFSGTTFDSDKSVKYVLQQSEAQHEAATADRALIRQEFANADTTLQNNIDAEAVTRANADTTINQNLSQETTNRVNGDNALQANINAEETARIAKDNELETAINTEVTNRTNAITAETTARTTAINNETTARTQAVTNLQNQLNNIGSGNIALVARIDSNGICSFIDTDSRNNQAFAVISATAGEIFIVDSDVTVSLLDGDMELKQGDKLTVTQATVNENAMSSASFVVAKANDSDLHYSNIGSSTVALNASEQLYVPEDSITSVELSDGVVDVLNDSFQKSNNDQTITADNTLIDVTTNSVAASQAVYIKRTQASTSALTGTVRASLQELYVNSAGSGNPLLPSAAHVNTNSSHYIGNCQDASIMIAGGNFEGNAKTGTNIIATGIYGTATKTQNGYNTGGIFTASGAQASNIAVQGFSDSRSTVSRGAIFALADSDINSWYGQRAVNLFTKSDVALILDTAYSSSNDALYAIGNVTIEGDMTATSGSVSNAPVNNNDIVRKIDLDNKSAVFSSLNLSSGSVTIDTSSVSFDVDSAIIQVKNNNEFINVTVATDNSNNQIVVTATGEGLASLTNVKVLVLSCN